MSSWAQNLEPLHCWRVLTLLPQHRLEEDHILAAVMGEVACLAQEPQTEGDGGSEEPYSREAVEISLSVSIP